MDLQNADCILIQGSNMAEAHPVGFRHPMIAREKGAKLIHIDPRFTRTSAMCDIYAPIRPGTDIAFLGGLINYVLENERYFEEYVVNYTNAATLINEDYEDVDEQGLFVGWNEDQQMYDPTGWRYEGAPIDYASVGGSQGRLMGDSGGGQVHPGDGREGDRLPEGGLPEGRGDHLRELRTREDYGLLLRRRLDPALQGRSDHPHRRHPSAPPGQHRASGRGHHGTAWTR